MTKLLIISVLLVSAIKIEGQGVIGCAGPFCASVSFENPNIAPGSTATILGNWNNHSTEKSQIKNVNIAIGSKNYFRSISTRKKYEKILGVTSFDSNKSFNNISKFENLSSKKNLNQKYLIRQTKSQLVHSEIQLSTGDQLSSLGCEIIVETTLKAIEGWTTRSCFIPSPDPGTKLACAVGLALRNKYFNKLVEVNGVEGCTFVITKTRNGIIKVTVKTKKEVSVAIEEIKSFANFMNTIEGALWLMYRLAP